MPTLNHFLGYGERRRIANTISKLFTVIAILSTLMVALSISTVWADSLSDLTDKKASTSSSNNSGLLKGLEDSVNFSEEEPVTDEIKEPLKRFFGIIVQIGAYILCGGLTAVTIIDMIYVCIPISQQFLSGGKSGQANQPTQSGGMGMPGGMGMGMPGGMGMTGGMYGGMHGGMHGGMGMPGGMGMSGGMGGQPQQTGGMCWVTSSALNAVASAGVVDPATGKALHPFKLYFKEARYTLVAVPILLTLAITGILGKLGFAIGNTIGGFIQFIIGMLGG